MQYKFLQTFGQFNLDEVVETTDLRFGSEDEATNQPHILALLESAIIEKASEVKIAQTPKLKE